MNIIEKDHAESAYVIRRVINVLHQEGPTQNLEVFEVPPSASKTLPNPKMYRRVIRVYEGPNDYELREYLMEIGPEGQERQVNARIVSSDPSSPHQKDIIKNLMRKYLNVNKKEGLFSKLKTKLFS